jgi:hypothetical protein
MERHNRYVYLLIETEKNDRDLAISVFEAVRKEPGLSLNAMEVFNDKGEMCENR